MNHNRIACGLAAAGILLAAASLPLVALAQSTTPTSSTPITSPPQGFVAGSAPNSTDSTLVSGAGIVSNRNSGSSSVSVVFGDSGAVPSPPPPPPPPPATEPSCATRLSYQAWQPSPQSQTQWVNESGACPAGNVGSRTWQAEETSSRSAQCVSPSAPVDPVWTDWSAWTATGATRNVSDTCQATCNTRLAQSPWNASPQTQVQWLNESAACPAGETGAHTWQAEAASNRTAQCANPNAPADPAWSAWSAWYLTGATRNVVNTCATTCGTRLRQSPWNASPQTQTRWVNEAAACPAGEIGSHTWQAEEASTRTAQCANVYAAADPYWTGWSAWYFTGAKRSESNTCHRRLPPPPPPCRYVRGRRICPIIP